MEFVVSHPSPDHPSDEDLFLHPSEQQSLAGDPESPGTPVKPCPATKPDQLRDFRSL